MSVIKKKLKTSKGKSKKDRKNNEKNEKGKKRKTMIYKTQHRTCGAGTDYPSRALEFTSGLLVGFLLLSI
jgi:hypothetical protein